MLLLVNVGSKETRSLVVPKGEKRGKEDMLIYLVDSGVRPVLDCYKDPYETFFLAFPQVV
jgi:hypothetical protein